MAFVDAADVAYLMVHSVGLSNGGLNTIGNQDNFALNTGKTDGMFHHIGAHENDFLGDSTSHPGTKVVLGAAMNGQDDGCSGQKTGHGRQVDAIALVGMNELNTMPLQNSQHLKEVEQKQGAVKWMWQKGHGRVQSLSLSASFTQDEDFVAQIVQRIRQFANVVLGTAEIEILDGEKNAHFIVKKTDPDSFLTNVH